MTIDFSDIHVNDKTISYVRDLLMTWAHWTLSESNGYPCQTPFADGGAMRTGFGSQIPRGVKIPTDVAMLQSLINFCEQNGFYAQIGAVKIWYIGHRIKLTDDDIAEQIGCDIAEFHRRVRSGENILAAQIDLADRHRQMIA